jgi:UDP-N-acetylglucosamine--N-acetylmuramyl-(pentapeptide) pyrophosphoryl-undecaprenol N-acetylglucosamine transferase
MKIILTGGITGGHIYPALAIGDKFKEMDPECEILYVGNERGMEKEIVPRHGFALKTVPSKSVDRSNVLKMAETLAVTKRGESQAYRIMKKFQPDIIISTGSYVSVPVVLAAHKFGAKVFIHEQNAFAGMANRFLSKFAEKVFLGFEDAGKYFKQNEKLVYTGNPVRQEFYGKDKNKAREILGIPEGDFVITAFGGSQGAAAINETAIEIIRTYSDLPNVTILFGTGKRYYEEVLLNLEVLGLREKENLHILPYIQDMANTLAATDIAICRSGALSVSEITMSGCPAIFIPSPNVTGDHQYYNAKAVVDNGGAIIVREDADTPNRVVNALKELIADPDLVKQMSENSLKCAPVHAADIVYKGIMDVWESK